MGVQSFLPFSPRQLPTRAWKKTADSGNDSRVKALISKWPWPVETHHCTDSLAAAGHASTCAGLVNCLFLYSFITLHFSNFPAHQKKPNQNKTTRGKRKILTCISSPSFKEYRFTWKTTTEWFWKIRPRLVGVTMGTEAIKASHRALLL